MLAKYASSIFVKLINVLIANILISIFSAIVVSVWNQNGSRAELKTMFTTN